MKYNLKAVVVDDEEDARHSVRHYVNKYLPTVELVGEADGVRAGVDLIKKLSPDVVFLDISMKDGTGFDLLDQLSDRSFQLIFVTGHDDHAIRAFKYSAIDYILKPIDADDFVGLSKKLSSYLDDDVLNKKLNNAKKMLDDDSYSKMALPYKDDTVFVELADIIHLESEGSYTSILTRKYGKVVVSRLIKAFEDLLPTSIFFRTHRSHIVNLNYVSLFRKSDEKLILRNKVEVPVARRRKDALLKLIN